jgi:hypothetical protein
LHGSGNQGLFVVNGVGCHWRLLGIRTGRLGGILRCLAGGGTCHGRINGGLTAGRHGGGACIRHAVVTMAGGLLFLMLAVALRGPCHGGGDGCLFVCGSGGGLGGYLRRTGCLLALCCLFCRPFCQSLGFFLFVPLQTELTKTMPLPGLVCHLLLLLCAAILLGAAAELRQ